MTMRRVMIFSRFERFWHWSQMTLIFILLFSGFAIHGLHGLLDFQTAVIWHTVCAVALIVLWVFAIFWHLTTGNWRHYLPTAKGLWPVARYYAYGIFRGERHPYRKAFWRKHNPLQALTYLMLKLVLFPAIWLTGLAYLLYPLWSEAAIGSGLLAGVALVHTAAAYAILVFVIAHIYVLTIGHFIAHVKPMLTGYDEIDLTPAEEAYLEETKSVPME